MKFGDYFILNHLMMNFKLDGLLDFNSRKGRLQPLVR